MALRNSPSTTRFVTNKMCPFAQKAWIALEFTETPYEMEEVPLYGAGGKPDWFLKLNRRGTVPVLVCRGGAVVLPDSDVILDEIEKGIIVPTNVDLVPSGDDDAKKLVKEWRDAINEMLPVGKDAVLSGSTRSLRDVLRKLDAKVVSPYLTGEKITTADCHAFPFIWRINDEFGLDEYPKLSAWLDCCRQEPAFDRTTQSSWWWWW